MFGYLGYRVTMQRAIVVALCVAVAGDANADSGLKTQRPLVAKDSLGATVLQVFCLPDEAATRACQVVETSIMGPGPDGTCEVVSTVQDFVFRQVAPSQWRAVTGNELVKTYTFTSSGRYITSFDTVLMDPSAPDHVMRTAFTSSSVQLPCSSFRGFAPGTR